ncbi:inositol phosphophingolipids phospholipase C [Amylostereum chailletii]|nr:inositol phosphophingolipids phospholipase C [Amylostereum chailletii]
MSEDQIRIFSLNCWGLKYVSKDRSDRVLAIADFLATAPYDIVALQELWVYADYEIVRASVMRYLPFAKFFYSGALGAGLAIFSRFPIIAATIQPYSLNGSPIDVTGGDWFVGKAAASVLITHPVLGQVQIFNTHLFAKGGEGGPEHHRAHRLVNAWEFAKLAKQSAEIGRYVIAAGDFNSIPTTLPMTVIRDHAGLTDAWASLHPPPSPSDISNSNSSPQDAISTYGVTADSPINTYSAGKPLDTHARAAQGKRLDYVLFRDPAPYLMASSSLIPPRPTLVCSHARVQLTELVPGRAFSYSDHFGLETTLTIKHPEHANNTLPSEAHDTSIASIAGPTSPFAIPHLSASATTSVLSALATCFRYAQGRSQRELAAFAGCLAFDFVLLFGASWCPTRWTPLLVLAGAVSTWWGTTMLYVGFVYGRWELNALMNVIEEMELYRRGVEGGMDGNDLNDVFKSREISF